MNQLRPGAIAMMAGGAVLLIGSFLDWQSFGSGSFSISANAWDRGLLGFFLLLISAVAIGVAAVDAFAPQVNLPEDILGFSKVQLVLVLGFAAFVVSFGLLFLAEGFKIGSILATLGSGAVVAGAIMEAGASPAMGSGGAEPPRRI